jgi:hypothetical protein
MYTRNEVIEDIYFKYFKNRIKSHQCPLLQRYSDNAVLHFALSHNALSQQSKVIVSKCCSSWYIGAVIASKSYRFVVY